MPHTRSRPLQDGTLGDWGREVRGGREYSNWGEEDDRSEAVRHDERR